MTDISIETWARARDGADQRLPRLTRFVDDLGGALLAHDREQIVLQVCRARFNTLPPHEKRELHALMGFAPARDEAPDPEWASKIAR